jgi:hypothetical protein
MSDILPESTPLERNFLAELSIAYLSIKTCDLVLPDRVLALPTCGGEKC